MAEILEDLKSSASTESVTEATIEFVIDVINNSFVDDSRKQVAQLAKGQPDNSLWFHYNKCVVSGSMVHGIVTRMNSIWKGKAKDADRVVLLCTTGKKGFRPPFC
mgnify:CR=1 FL=1